MRRRAVPTDHPWLRNGGAGLRCAGGTPDGAWPSAYGLLALLATAAILFARSSDAFLHPVAGWEDATQGLNTATAADATPLHFYAGYVSVLPNLVDWAAVKLLPLHVVPYAQALFALAAASCIGPALAAFFGRVVGLSPVQATISAIVVACLPWGDAAAVSNTEFSIWSLFFILIVTALLPLPQNAAGLVVAVGWRAAIITSNPLCIVCGPIWLLGAWRRRSKTGRVACATLVLVTAGYVAFAVDHRAGSALSMGGLAPCAGVAIRLMSEKSLLAIVVRGVFRTNFADLPLWLCVLSLVAAWVGLWWLLRGKARCAVLVLAGVLVTVCAATALGRGGGDGGTLVLHSPRYHTIPQLLWLTMFAIAGWARASCSAAQARVTLVCALLAGGLFWSKGLKAYKTNQAAESAEIIAFLKTAEAAQGREMHLNRKTPDGDWSLTINTHPKPTSPRQPN